MIPLINGRAFDFAQIIVNILGVPLAGIASVEYSESQEKVNNYGAGKNPVSRGHGAVEREVSLEIHMNDIEAIRTVAPFGKLLNIPPFDITVTYLNGAVTVTHILKSCEFTTDGISASQGDTQISKSFDLVCADIVYQ